MIQQAEINQEEVMRNLNKLASSTNVTSALFEASINYLTDSYNIDVVMIYLLDKDIGLAHLSNSTNLPQRYIESLSTLDEKGGRLYDVIKRNKIISVLDVQQDNGFGSDIKYLNKKGALGIPFFKLHG